MPFVVRCWCVLEEGDFPQGKQTQTSWGQGVSLLNDQPMLKLLLFFYFFRSVFRKLSKHTYLEVLSGFLRTDWWPYEVG